MRVLWGINESIGVIKNKVKKLKYNRLFAGWILQRDILTWIAFKLPSTSHQMLFMCLAGRGFNWGKVKVYENYMNILTHWPLGELTAITN